MKKIIVFSIIIFSVCSESIFSQQYITGGGQINVSETPWQVLLQINESYACGGSIIAPNFILTAKHCVESNIPGVAIPANTVKVIAGITCKSETNASNIYDVQQIILHPTLDVALLKLNLPLIFNNAIKMVNYTATSNGALYNTGVNVKVSGWGWLTPGGYDAAECLNAVDLHIISNADANNMLGGGVSDNEVSTIGVGSVRQGACHGDSGGPLVTWSNELNQYVLIGVVSWGISGCYGNNTNSPSIFVRVSKLVDWIGQSICPLVIANQTLTADHFFNACCDIEISNTTIEQNANVTVTSNESISILPPFHAKAGSSFHAKIEPCETAASGSSPLLARKQENTDNDVTEMKEVTGNYSEIKIYPNPATDWINIQIPNPEKIRYIEICNLQGICLTKLQGAVSEETKINIASWPAGIYFVVVSSEDNLRSFKLIKQ
ncbi:MAG: trypsin-like serine protease [Dysgonamonadaceae bacterium]|jgi:secreted trypsin-like serine protease|nr:trypsin-like serine protease [Dysgonamonadaceae bacterium]